MSGCRKRGWRCCADIDTAGDAAEAGGGEIADAEPQQDAVTVAAGFTGRR